MVDKNKFFYEQKLFTIKNAGLSWGVFFLLQLSKFQTFFYNFAARFQSLKSNLIFNKRKT